MIGAKIQEPTTEWNSSLTPQTASVSSDRSAQDRCRPASPPLSCEPIHASRDFSLLRVVDLSGNHWNRFVSSVEMVRRVERCSREASRSEEASGAVSVRAVPPPRIRAIPRRHGSPAVPAPCLPRGMAIVSPRHQDERYCDENHHTHSASDASSRGQPRAHCSSACSAP